MCSLPNFSNHFIKTFGKALEKLGQLSRIFLMETREENHAEPPDPSSSPPLRNLFLDPGNSEFYFDPSTDSATCSINSQKIIKPIFFFLAFSKCHIFSDF